jgi:CHAT domain-containing protein
MSIYSKPLDYWNAPALQHFLLGFIHAYLGDYSEAYAANSQALHFAQQASDVRDIMAITFNRGYIDLLAGNWSSADRHLRSTLRLAEKQRNLDFQRRALTHLGLLHELQHDHDAAEQRYRDAVQVIEEYRSSLRATQWSVTSFTRWQDAYRGLTRTLLAQDRPVDAFQVLERTRARHLKDLRIQDRLSQDLPSSQRVRYDSLTRALVDLRNQLAEASAAEAGSLRSAETRLIADRRQLLDFRDPPDSTDVNALQDTLRRQQRTLVSYFLDAPSQFFDRQTRSHAFVVTGDSIHAVALSGITQRSVQSRIEMISPLFTAQGKTSGINEINFDLRPLHTLHERLFEPLRFALSPGNRIAIVPDGPLFHLPFSALVTEPPSGRFSYESASFLLDEYPTSVTLSATLLAVPDSASASPPANDLAAFGVSDFRAPRSVPRSVRAALPGFSADSSTVRLASLPGVRREIQTLRSLVDRGQFALDERATESAFHSSEQNARILHLASHAFVHPTSPLYNAFVLAAGPSDSPRDDGWLFLHEIQSDDAPIPLVVLSGCSTARGALRSGEGMEGLQYAFRAMGAQSTVSNLWPADDEAAVELVRTFYRNLQSGHPKDVALQKAQQSYVDNHPDRVSPFFWSSTVLYGTPRPVSLSPPSLLTQLFRALPQWSPLLFLYLAGLVVGSAYALVSSSRQIFSATFFARQ